MKRASKQKGAGKPDLSYTFLDTEGPIDKENVLQKLADQYAAVIETVEHTGNTIRNDFKRMMKADMQKIDESHGKSLNDKATGIERRLGDSLLHMRDDIMENFGIHQRDIKALDAKVAGIEKTLTVQGQQIKALDAKVAGIEKTLTVQGQQIKALDAKVDGIEQRLGDSIESLRKDMMENFRMQQEDINVFKAEIKETLNVFIQVVQQYTIRTDNRLDRIERHLGLRPIEEVEALGGGQAYNRVPIYRK